MTHEKKVLYLKKALALQNIGINDRMADQILVTLDLIQEKQDDFTLRDAIEIDVAIDRKYKEKELKDGS